MLESPLEHAWVELLGSTILKARDKDLEEWALGMLLDIFGESQTDDPGKDVRDYLEDHYDRDPADFAMLLTDMWNHTMDGRPIVEQEKTKTPEWAAQLDPRVSKPFEIEEDTKLEAARRAKLSPKEIKDETSIWDQLPPEAQNAMWDHSKLMESNVQQNIINNLDYWMVRIIRAKLFQTDEDQIREHLNKSEAFETYQGTDNYTRDIKKEAERMVLKLEREGKPLPAGWEEIVTASKRKMHQLRIGSPLELMAQRNVDNKKMPSLGISNLDGGRVRQFFECFEHAKGYEEWGPKLDKALGLISLKGESSISEKRIMEYMSLIQTAKQQDLLEEYVKEHWEGRWSGAIKEDDSDIVKWHKKNFKDITMSVKTSMQGYELSPTYKDKVERELDRRERRIRNEVQRGQHTEGIGQLIISRLDEQVKKDVYGWRVTELLKHGKYKKEAQAQSYRTPEMKQALEQLGLYWGDNLRPPGGTNVLSGLETMKGEETLRQSIQDHILSFTDIAYSALNVSAGQKDESGNAVTSESISTQSLLNYWESIPTPVKKGMLGIQFPNGAPAMGVILNNAIIPMDKQQGHAFLLPTTIEKFIDTIIHQGQKHHGLSAAGTRSAKSSEGLITNATASEIKNYLDYTGGARGDISEDTPSRENRWSLVDGEKVVEDPEAKSSVAELGEAPTIIPMDTHVNPLATKPPDSGQQKPENTLEGIQIRRSPRADKEMMNSSVDTWITSGKFSVEDMWTMGLLQSIIQQFDESHENIRGGAQLLDMDNLKGPAFQAWSLDEDASLAHEHAWNQYRFGAAEKRVRSRYYNLYRLLHNQQTSQPEGSETRVEESDNKHQQHEYNFTTKDIAKIVSKDIFQKMWISGKGYLGRRTSDIPYEILPSSKRADLVKHTLCDGKGNNLNNGFACGDPRCYGVHPDQPHLAGHLLPVHLLPSAEDPKVREWLIDRVKELVGKTISADGEREELGENHDMINDDVIGGIYTPGFAQQVRDADELECRARGLVKPCPGYPDINMSCTHGKTIGVSGKERDCNRCSHTDIVSGKRQSNGLLADRGALWPAIAAERGSNTLSFEEIGRRRRAKERIAIGMREFGSHSLNEKEDDDKSRKGIWPAIPGPDDSDPRKDSPFAYDVHILSLLPQLHTPKAPLHLDSVVDLKDWARDEILKMHGKENLTDDELSQYMKNLIRHRFEDFFDGMEYGDEFIKQLIETSFSGPPSEAANTDSMEEIYSLLIANPRESVSAHTKRMVSNVLQGFHRPDVDGRNMLVDNGLHNSTPCKACSGEKLEAGPMGYTMGHDCEYCCGTGDDMVRKLRSRSAVIGAMSHEDIQHQYISGALQGIEPERAYSYWHHPRTIGRRLDTRFITPGESATAWGITGLSGSGDDSSWSQRNKPQVAPRTQDLYGTGSPSSEIMQAYSRGPPIYAHDDAIYQFQALLGKLRVLHAIKGQITLDAPSQKELERAETQLKGLLENLSHEGIAKAVYKFCGTPLEELLPKSIKGDITAGAHIIPDDLTHEDSLDDVPCLVCKRLHALGMHPENKIYTLGEHDDLQLDEDGVPHNLSMGRCPFTSHEDDLWMGSVNNQKDYYKLYLNPDTPLQIKNLINGVDNTRILLRDMEGEGQLAISKKHTRTRTDHTSNLTRSLIRKMPPRVVLGETMRNYGGKSWLDKIGVRGTNLLPAKETDYQELKDHRILTHIENNILPDRLSDIKNKHMARIMAMHILEPYHGIDEHQNVFSLPFLNGRETDIDPKFKKLTDWARKALGKDQEGVGEHSHSLTDGEKYELYDYLHIINHMSKLQRLWNKYLFTDFSVRKNDDGSDLPEYIFNFDDPEKPFLDMSEGGHMDEVFGRLRAHATTKASYIRDASINQNDYAFLQRWEHHPSMQYMADDMRSHELYTAWLHHDEKALKQIALNSGKPEDYYWLEGKTLQEVRESGLLDDMWTHMTGGNDFSASRNYSPDPLHFKLSGTIFPIGDAAFMDDEGNLSPDLNEWTHYWLALQDEIRLRCDDTKESKKQLHEGAKRYPPDGHNRQGTAQRCGLCDGHGVHSNVQEFLLHHGKTFPHMRVLRRNEDGDAIDTRLEESPWDDEGLLDTRDAISGSISHELNNSRTLNFILNKASPPGGSYKTGPQAWRSAYENLLRHDLGGKLGIPSDAKWEETNLDGESVLTDYAVRFIQESTPSCYGCEGRRGHGDYLTDFPLDVQSAINAMNLILAHSYNEGVGLTNDGGPITYNPSSAIWISEPQTFEQLRDLEEEGLVPATGHGSAITTQQFMDSESLRYMEGQQRLAEMKSQLEAEKALCLDNILSARHPYEKDVPLGEPILSPTTFTERQVSNDLECPDCDGKSYDEQYKNWRRNEPKMAWHLLHDIQSGERTASAKKDNPRPEPCTSCGGLGKLKDLKFEKTPSGNYVRDSEGEKIPLMETIEMPQYEIGPEWAHSKYHGEIEERLETIFKRRLKSIESRMEYLSTKRGGDVYGDITKRMQAHKEIEKSNIHELSTIMKQAQFKILEASDDELKRWVKGTLGWTDQTLEMELGSVPSEAGRLDRLRNISIDRQEGPILSKYDNETVSSLRGEMVDRGWEKIPSEWSRETLKEKLINHDRYTRGNPIRCQVSGCVNDDGYRKLATFGRKEIFRDNGAQSQYMDMCDDHQRWYNDNFHKKVKGSEGKVVGGMQDLMEAMTHGFHVADSARGPRQHRMMGLFPRADQEGGGTHWIPIMACPPDSEHKNSHFKSIIEIPGHTRENIEMGDESVKSRDEPGWDSTSGVAAGIGTVMADFRDTHSGGDIGDQWVRPKGALRLCPDCNNMLPSIKDGVAPACTHCGLQPSTAVGGMKKIHYTARGVAAPGGYGPLVVSKPLGFRMHRDRLRERLRHVQAGERDPALIPCRCVAPDNRAGVGFQIDPRNNEKIPCQVCKPHGAGQEKGWALHPDDLPLMTHYNLNVKAIKTDSEGTSVDITIPQLRALLEERLKKVTIRDGELTVSVPKKYQNILPRFDELFRKQGKIPYTLAVPHPGYGANLAAHSGQNLEDDPFKKLGTAGQVGGLIMAVNGLLRPSNNPYTTYYQKLTGTGDDMGLIEYLIGDQKGWKGPKEGNFGKFVKEKWIPSSEMGNFVEMVEEQYAAHDGQKLDPVNKELQERRAEFISLHKNIAAIMKGMQTSHAGGNKYSIQGLGDIDRGKWGDVGRMSESLMPMLQKISKYFEKNIPLSVDALSNGEGATDLLMKMETGSIDQPIAFHNNAYLGLTDAQKIELQGERTWGIASRAREDQMGDLLDESQDKMLKHTISYEPRKGAEEAMDAKHEGNMAHYNKAVKHFADLYSSHPIYQWPETWVGLDPPHEGVVDDGPLLS